MIRVESLGEVTFFRMARRLMGWPVYWTGAYLVDGLLVDCGPPATARAFVRALAARPVDALVVTKLDGSAKGGVLVALAEKFKLPVVAVGVGEGIDDLQPFEARAFARSLMGLPV